MDKLNGRKKIVFSRYMAQYKSHIKHIMELPDSPRKIAAGMAVGIIFEFLPIPIISVPLTFLLSKCIRANAVAAVITGIICKIAVQMCIRDSPKAANVVLVGVLARRLPIAEDLWQKALADKVPAKFLEVNQAAFERGYHL